MRARIVRFTAAFQALLLMGTLVVPALVAATGITTDLWVYQDGDTVTVTGVEYGPSEVVDFVTTDPDGVVVDSGSASSDDAGGVQYQFVLHATQPGIYDVVGTGETSGFGATTQFDPGGVAITTVAFQWFASPTSFDVTVAGTFSCTTGGSGTARCSTPGSVDVSLFPTDNTNNSVAGTAIAPVKSAPTTITSGTCPSNCSGTWTTTYQFRSSPGVGQYAIPGAIPTESKYDVQAKFNWTGAGGAGSDTKVDDNRFGIDVTPPTVSLSVTSGTLGAGGWYTSNVTVHTAGTDTSGDPLSCTADQVINTDTTGTVVNGSCTDQAGQTVAAAPITIKRDASAPSASLSITAGTAGSNGWRTSDVTVHTSGADATSGIVSCTTDQSQTTETPGTAFNGSCTNGAGLTTNAAPLTVKLDKTAPTANLAVTGGTLGSDGWYITNVTATATGTDSISSPVVCAPSPQTVSSETTGITLNATCTNDAGLSTAASPLTVKLDKTGPIVTLSVTGGTLGSNGWYTSDVTLHTSGTESISVPVSGCTADQVLNANSTGTTFNGSCVDDAGITGSAAPQTVKLDKSAPTSTVSTATGSAGAASATGSASDVGPSGLNNGTPKPLHVEIRSASCGGTLFAGSSMDLNAPSGNWSYTAPTAPTAPGTYFVVSVATDMAGNVQSVAGCKSYTIASTDSTPPVITKVITGTAGTNGWYTSNVTVAWTVTDPESSFSINSGCGTQNFITETAAATSSCSATSAGGTASDSVILKIDKSAPSASLAVTAGTAGTNGWYTSNVTVATTGTDSISNPTVCTTNQSQTTETTGQAFNGSCTNDAGLTANAAPLTVKLDKSAPSAALAVTAGTAGSNGWYTSNVTVGTSGTDAISGIAGCSVDQTQTVETAGAVFNGSCTNGAGVVGSAAPLNVKLDKTGPSATLAVTAGTLGANNWYTSDVTVSTTGSDSISDPTSCTGDQFQTTDTTAAGQDFDGSCTNDAGLSTDATTLNVKLDESGPTAVLSVTAGAAGDNGWYTSDVTVSTTGSDDQGSVSCSLDQSQTLETAGAVFDGSCTNDAGETTYASPLTVKLDKTGPSASLAADRAPDGANGWYIADLTVSTTGSDSISNPTTCTAAQPWSTETADHAFAGSCTNDAGLTTDATTLHVKLDKTGPTATLAADRAPDGAHGWYVADLTVSTTGSDSVSNPTTCTAAQPWSTETADHTFAGSCTNDAGLATNATALHVKLDKTGPSATLTPSGTAGLNGWFTDDVTITTSGSDTISDPTVCTGSQSQTTETLGQVFSGSCTNDAGIPTSATDITVKLDKTAPTSVVLTPTGTAGLNDWFVDDVTITTTGSDAISGVASCTAPQHQTTETAGVTFVGNCTNEAGLTSNPDASVGVKLDKTAPTSVVLTPTGTAGAHGWFIGNVTITTTGSDDISGVVGCTTPQSQTSETAGATFFGNCTNGAGLTSNPDASVTVKLDKTGPSATLAADRAPDGANGWYIADLTVSTTGSDSISNPTTCTAAQPWSTETADHAFAGSCTNDAGLTTNAAALHVKLDKTGPTATLAVTAGTAGSNGWYTSDVTVSTTGSDSISNPTTCALDQFQTTETAGATFNGQCTNDAGLSSNATPLSVKLDKTGPSASLAVSAGTLGAHGWYTSDVTVSTTGTDTISNPTTCTAIQSQTTETTGHVFNGSCTNNAGLSTTATALTVKLDKTAPSAALAVTAGTLGNNGWYTSNVTVSTSGNDSISNPTTCTVDQFQTTDTSGSPFNGSCTNDAGLSTSAATLTVKLDKTNPSVAITSPSTGLITVASSIAVSGTDSDTPSGIDTVTVNGYTTSLGSGTFTSLTVPLPNCGANTITALATDKAGRTSTSSITVTHVCIGSLAYYQPLDQSTGATPVINTGKSGRVIPVKVTGSLSVGGTPVAMTDTFLAANGLTLRIGVNMTSCTNTATTDDIEAYADAGAANDNTNIFRYSSGQWIYNLDTGKAPSVVMTVNKCYRLDVYIQDAGGTKILVSTGPGAGLNPYAIFQPTK